jgi:hypothetical protein
MALPVTLARATTQPAASGRRGVWGGRARRLQRCLPNAPLQPGFGPLVQRAEPVAPRAIVQNPTIQQGQARMEVGRVEDQPDGALAFGQVRGGGAEHGAPRGYGLVAHDATGISAPTIAPRVRAIYRPIGAPVRPIRPGRSGPQVLGRTGMPPSRRSVPGAGHRSEHWLRR